VGSDKDTPIVPYPAPCQCVSLVKNGSVITHNSRIYVTRLRSFKSLSPPFTAPRPRDYEMSSERRPGHRPVLWFGHCSCSSPSFVEFVQSRTSSKVHVVAIPTRSTPAYARPDGAPPPETLPFPRFRFDSRMTQLKSRFPSQESQYDLA